MERRPTVAIALVFTLALAGCTAGYQPAADGVAQPDSPSEEHLGYYDGYWYNDTFDINTDSGLTAAEAEAVFSRAMARIQMLRGLRFESDVGIEVISRETFREEFDDLWGEPTENIRTLDNAQHEALFLVGPDEDIVDVRKRNRGGTVLGFYQPSTERIVIVSGNDPATLENELTLAHELLHALQDQQFGLVLNSPTLDSANARNGLIEGDARVVEREYERNCETGEWQCVDAQTASGSSLPPNFHWGVYFVGYFPYAEGPSFIQYHRDAGGWEAVNTVYDDYPATSAEIIRPETYGTDAYGDATVHDRTAGGWERVRIQNGSDAATVGRAGLASMFAYTAYAGDPPGVIGRNEFRTADVDASQPYAYNVSYTEGWYADRLHAYKRGEQTAYVWNVTFNDADNATAFLDGYERVAAHWEGTQYADTDDGSVWTFDERRFDGAVRIDRDGNAVTVVKAPSTRALGSVYTPAEVAVAADTQTATAD
jgi:hypothetical protein